MTKLGRDLVYVKGEFGRDFLQVFPKKTFHVHANSTNSNMNFFMFELVTKPVYFLITIFLVIFACSCKFEITKF